VVGCDAGGATGCVVVVGGTVVVDVITVATGSVSTTVVFEYAGNTTTRKTPSAATPNTATRITGRRV
jgi:hypothetical protein